MNKKYYILVLLIINFINCSTDNKNSIPLKKELIRMPADTLSSPKVLHSDTVLLKETHDEEDIISNEYLTKQLKPVRQNFKRINSINEWTTIDTKDLWESTEGGEAKFYYLGKNLEKISSRHFGETFQQLTEYYILNGRLSFVFEKLYEYNRPVYYDSAVIKESDDKEIFDFEKSEIIEDRSYFENGELIHQINNQDCGPPFANDYLLKEQKRLKTDFDKLKKLAVLNKKAVPGFWDE